MGLEFCAEALARGYQLTIYVRNPSKLPGDISGHSKVTVIKGSLDDEESLGRAIASNATVFVSFLGPAASSTGTVRFTIMRNSNHSPTYTNVIT